jgi:S1/P1 Nuclease
MLRIWVTSLLVLLTAVLPAYGWSLSGHKIIASIAFRQLTPQQQARAVAMLKRHPRFAQDFAEQMPEEIRGGEEAAQNEWIFQQAAIWPDTIRSGPLDKTAFSRPEWHYINGPVFLDSAAHEALEGKLPINVEKNPPADATVDTLHMNVMQALRLARGRLSSKDASPTERAVLLAWVYHLVGDIHQPLHSSALVSQRLFPEGDRGGNSIKLKQSYNLHSLWDGFPGEAMEYRVARNRAIVYADEERWRTLGNSAAAELHESVWLAESELVAKISAYDQEVLAAVAKMEAGGRAVQEIELSERYLKAGGAMAEWRMVQAGYRLGAVVKGIVSSQ